MGEKKEQEKQREKGKTGDLCINKWWKRRQLGREIKKRKYERKRRAGNIKEMEEKGEEREGDSNVKG